MNTVKTIHTLINQFVFFAAPHREYYCSTRKTTIFLKLIDAGSMPVIFATEATRLDALCNSSSIDLPQIIQHGIEQNKQRWQNEYKRYNKRI